MQSDNAEYGELLYKGFSFKGYVQNELPQGKGFLNFFLFKHFFCFDGFVSCSAGNDGFKFQWYGPGVLHFGNGWEAHGDWDGFAKSQIVMVLRDKQVQYDGPCDGIEDLLSKTNLMNDKLRDDFCSAQELPSRILVAYRNSNNIIVGYVFNSETDDNVVNIVTLDTEGVTCLQTLPSTAKALLITDENKQYIYTYKDVLDDFAHADFCGFMEEGQKLQLNKVLSEKEIARRKSPPKISTSTVEKLPISSITKHTYIRAFTMQWLFHQKIPAISPCTSTIRDARIQLQKPYDFASYDEAPKIFGYRAMNKT